MAKKLAVNLTKRALLVICVALLLAVAGSAVAAPRLVLAEEAFDFGIVPQNAKISHVFWLKSSGDDSLIITKVVPGCGCTQAPLQNSELAAGDSTQLEIIFSTRSYRNRVVKSPRIETNAGPPYQHVRISAQVVTRPDSTYPLIFTPYKLDISQFGEKIRDRMSFRISNVSDRDLRITLIDLPHELVELKMPASLKAGETVEGELRLKEGAVDQSFEKSFTLEVGDDQSTRYTIPVKRTIRQPGEQASATGSTTK